MVDRPTDEEIAKVRRWECSANGHDLNIITTGNGSPITIICGRCGARWPVGMLSPA